MTQLDTQNCCQCATINSFFIGSLQVKFWYGKTLSSLQMAGFYQRYYVE